MLHGLADGLAWFSYRLVGYRKKVVFENLRLAFPEWEGAQIRKTARAFYGHLADVLVESVKSLSLSEREMRKRMQLENPELFDQLKADGKGIMLSGSIRPIRMDGDWFAFSSHRRYLPYFNRFAIPV